MVLADLGAEVIKVEPPGGDETRSWAPIVKGESVYFMSANRGKKSIVVDLRRPEGREVVYRLAARSHIVFENYRPGVREKLGVDPETLFKVNRNLVYVSIKGFRPGSKYELKPAYDIIVQAMSGLMATTGEEGRPPVRVSFALFDIIAGLLAALYAVAALRSPSRPVYIELPLYDTAVFSMVYIPLMYLVAGVKPKRMGSGHPSIVPYQAFRGSDGKWFIVAAANDRLWRSLCRALGVEHLANDPRFRSNPDRVRNRSELVKILEEVFSRKPRSYWLKVLEEAGVPVAPVYDVDEVFADDYSKDMVYEIEHPVLGKVKQLAEPGTINGERPLSTQPPPLLGQHTIELLKWLGYSDEEIDRLIREKVVAAPERHAQGGQ
jgi:formyl-CoA transferase